uniref:Uncharacterized protein n=1 Tax=viral metagenome TaxID=1070528 RepID=A0A6C0HTV8_9ZZZZ
MPSKRTYKRKGSRKHKSSKRHHRRHAKKNMIIMGGDSGATGHALGVYGGIGQQHAQSNGSNVIAMNGGANLLENQLNLEGMNRSHIVTGGQQQQQQLQQGGEVLTEVAVPVALLALNQGLVPKRHTGKHRHHRSNRRYRR